METLSKKELEQRLRSGATVRHSDSKKLYRADQAEPKAQLAPLLDKEALKGLNEINETAGKRIDAAINLLKKGDGVTQKLMEQIHDVLKQQAKRVPYEFEIIRDAKGNLTKVKATPIEA